MRRKFSGTFRPDNTYTVTAKNSLDITISAKGISINGYWLDPSKPQGAQTMIFPIGIGVFCWHPLNVPVVAALADNVKRCKEIIYNEEKKAHELFNDAGKQIDKRLQGAVPSNEDYKFLYETHGLPRNIVDEYLELTGLT